MSIHNTKTYAKRLLDGFCRPACVNQTGYYESGILWEEAMQRSEHSSASIDLTPIGFLPRLETEIRIKAAVGRKITPDLLADIADTAASGLSRKLAQDAGIKCHDYFQIGFCPPSFSSGEEYPEGYYKFFLSIDEKYAHMAPVKQITRPDELVKFIEKNRSPVKRSIDNQISTEVPKSYIH